MAWNPTKSAKELVNKTEDAVTGGAQAAMQGDLKGVAQNFIDPLKDPYKQMKAGVDAAGSSIGNAYQTSVVDPLKKAGAQAQAGIKHLQDMFSDAYNGLGTPSGPTGGAGGNGMVVAAPGMPGQGGGAPGSVAMPQVTAGLNPDQANTFRDAQTALLSQLQNQASPTYNGPSIAQNQLRMGQEQALAQNIALANSARGGANPMAARQALQQNAQMSGQMANEAANLRLQEQMNAQNALSSLAGQGRQGDIQLSQLAQQGQVAQAQIAQAQNELAAKYAQMGMDAQTANQKAQIELQKLSQEGQLGFANLGLQSQIAQNALLGNAMQGGSGVLAGLGTMFSDKRLKTDIRDADQDIYDMLENAEVGSYEYKNKAHGEGRFISPMAQGLLKSKLGSQMVERKPEGYAVNYGANLGLILAAQASLHKRIKELENS